MSRGGCVQWENVPEEDTGTVRIPADAFTSLFRCILGLDAPRTLKAFILQYTSQGLALPFLQVACLLVCLPILFS
jgi:hypothetical protein